MDSPTPEHQKVMMVSYHLEEKALIWFQDVEQANGFPSWEVFIKALHTHDLPDPITLAVGSRCVSLSPDSGGSVLGWAQTRPGPTRGQPYP